MTRARQLTFALLLLGCASEARSTAPLRPAPAAQPPTPARAAALTPAELTTLLRLIQLGRATSTEDLAQLEAALRSATPAERHVLERMAHLARSLEPLLAGEPKPVALMAALNELAEILRAAAALFPDDVSTQRMVVATFLTLPTHMEMFGLVDPGAERAFRDEGEQRSNALAERFSNDAGAHALHAAACDSGKHDELTCLRRWARCAALDATSSCVETYARAAQAYVAPRCSAADIRANLGFYRARDVASLTAGQPLSAAIETAPTFRGVDLDSITFRADGVIVRVRPEHSAAFEAWTADLHASGHGLALVLGSKLLVGARVHRALAGSFMLSGAEPGELCAQTRQRTLPADLPPPAR